jgi:hypothetical protein
MVDFSSLLCWLTDSLFKKIQLIYKTVFESNFMEQKIYQTILNFLTQICFYLKAFTSWGTKGGCRAVAPPPKPPKPK